MSDRWRNLAHETGRHPNWISIRPPVKRLDPYPIYGRDRLIEAIYPSPGAARQNGSASVHVLHGPGGSGKSHVALEVARRAQRAWGEENVWWISADRIESAMQALARALGVRSEEIAEAWGEGTASATDLVWDRLHANEVPWLLVLDNADRPWEVAPADGRVADGTGWLRWPRTKHGIVLVTTRDGGEGTWGSSDVAYHRVMPLSIDDAAAVLLQMAPQAGDTHEAWRLGEALGGLPLALRGAGQYLRSVGRSGAWLALSQIRTFDDYRRIIDQPRSPVVDPPPDELEELLGSDLIERVWNVPLDVLSSRGHLPARTLLYLMSYLDEAPIPLQALFAPKILLRSPLFANVRIGQIREALHALEDLSLLEPETKDGVPESYRHMVSMHKLTRRIAREQSGRGQDVRVFYQLIMELLEAAVDELGSDVLRVQPAWHCLVPHTVECVRDYLRATDGPPGTNQTTLRALRVARESARYLIAANFPFPTERFLSAFLPPDTDFGLGADCRELLLVRHELAKAKLIQGRAAEAVTDLSPLLRYLDDRDAADTELSEIAVTHSRALNTAEAPIGAPGATD